MRGCGMALMLVLCCGGHALAQTLTLTFVTEGSGISLSGSGTGSASVTLGSVQAFGGTVPSGVTKTINDGSSFTLSTPIGVEVTQNGQLSPSYTLTGRLMFSDLQNGWKVNAVPLSTIATTITNSGAYGVTANEFSLTIPFSAPAGSISNTIDFIVTSN
jgi:hypothetical protein